MKLPATEPRIAPDAGNGAGSLELSAAEVLEQVCTLLQVRISDAGEVTPANLLERVNRTIDALSETTHKLEQLTRSHAELARTVAIVKAAVSS